jgi:hypothetical protein
MYSIHIKKRLSDLLALSALLLFIALEMVGCKDMEDCRSLYDTDVVWIEFKGNNSLKVDHAEITSTSDGKKRLEDTLFNLDDKKAILEALKNLKGKQLFFHLPPKDTSVTLLLYKTPSDTQTDTITLHYHAKHSLLSPDCGIQQVYVVESIETSFQSSTILVPEGKVADHKKTGKSHVEISY